MSPRSDFTHLDGEERGRGRKVGKMLTALDLKLEADHLAATGELPTIVELLRHKAQWRRTGPEVLRWSQMARIVEVAEPSTHTCALAETMLDAQLQVLFLHDMHRAAQQAEKL